MLYRIKQTNTARFSNNLLPLGCCVNIRDLRRWSQTSKSPLLTLENVQMSTNRCTNISATSKNISLHPALPTFRSWLQHIKDKSWWLELQSCVSRAVSGTHQQLGLSLPDSVCSLLTHDIKHCLVDSPRNLHKECINLCAKNNAHEQKTSSWFHTRFVTTAKEIGTEQSHAVKQNVGICDLLQEHRSSRVMHN